MDLQEASIILDFLMQDATSLEPECFNDMAEYGYDFSVQHTPIMLDDLKQQWACIYIDNLLQSSNHLFMF